MNNSVRGLNERNERTVPLYQIYSKVQNIVVHSTSVLTLKLLFFSPQQEYNGYFSDSQKFICVFSGIIRSLKTLGQD